MEDGIRLTIPEVFTYVAVFHAVVGLVLGLIPLIVGLVKKKFRTGLLGLVVATVGGALLGFLGSIPAMAIFTWLILRDQIKPVPGSSSTDGQHDIDNGEN